MTNQLTPFDGMDRLFDQMRRSMFGSEMAGGDWMPVSSTPVRMEETDDGVVVLVDIPGFETDELDVRLDAGFLTISGSHAVREGESYRERSVSERISVPEAVREDEITARYHNGVLEVHLPVSDGGDGGHRITIE